MRKFALHALGRQQMAAPAQRIGPRTLKSLIIESLTAQGFRIDGRAIKPPRNLNKARLRALHADAVDHRIERSKNGLVRHEAELLKRFAAGHEVNPAHVYPRLVEVQSAGP